MAIAKENITGLILAGGRGLRMGGADKGLIMLNGRTMIEHVIERIQRQTNDILISANRNLERYRRLGYRVVGDDYPNYQGPLAGIASGLRRARTDYVAIAPCDTPLINESIVARLANAIDDTGSPIAAAHDGARLQQAFLFLHRTMLSSVEQFLASNERKIETWLGYHRIAVVDFSDCPEAFINVNDVEDCRNALLRLQVRQAS